MLSNRLTSIRSSENKLSKKEKKRLAKAALEEVEIESCTPSDINNDEKVNKYLNIVNKKLRTLRKRMNKIEKYENCDIKELNADQISTIKKKSEVSALIKEFEDLHKQYTLFDEQDQKEQETIKKLQDEKLVKEINEKVENEKKLHSSQLQYLFKISYALNVVINTRKITFSHSELNALSYVRNVLLGSNEVNENNNQKSDGEILLEKLYEKSMDECCEGVTYKDVNDLINLIINPPQVTKKENSQTLSFFSQDATVDYDEQQPQPHQQLLFKTNKDEEIVKDEMNEVSISISKINFMQPNECIDEEIEEFQQDENSIQENQELVNETDFVIKEDTETNEINEENNIAVTEIATEETQTSIPEEKKSTEQPQQNKGYQNNQNNQFQKKRGYYRGGRGRRYQNGQYNNRHGNGYKNSRNNGYYPQQQNQNYTSYYYNNRSATF
eukprot:jgi/Orpsp1_1/1188093/evm.model.d7180000062395.1